MSFRFRRNDLAELKKNKASNDGSMTIMIVINNQNNTYFIR